MKSSCIVHRLHGWLDYVQCALYSVQYTCTGVTMNMTQSSSAAGTSIAVSTSWPHTLTTSPPHHHLQFHHHLQLSSLSSVHLGSVSMKTSSAYMALTAAAAPDSIQTVVTVV